ncbi:MAG: AAA family ATPase [Candidatus Sericytochromatia bacterium]|nr:AAA family ATPase [Candidatus Sericytochromatia bacterium]
MDIKEDLEKVLKLLKIEQDEEINQYRLKVLETPLSIRKKQGITWYPILITDTQLNSNQKILIEVEKTNTSESSNNFQQGKVIALFSNSEHNKNDLPFITGIITYSKNNNLKISMNTDELPEWVEDGKLGLDLFYDERSYREMNFAVNKVISSENKHIVRLKEVLLGYRQAEFVDQDEKIFFPDLNDSQNNAIKKIASAVDLAIIHGPPGTGKTTTLVKAIEYTLRTEKQVLVSAPSNTAVDLLTQKISENGIRVIRIGHPARVSTQLQKYSLDEQIINHAHYKELVKLKKQANELRNKAIKFKRSFGREERENRKSMLLEVKAMLVDVKKMEKSIIDDLFDKAQVITCTLVGASSNALRDKIFSTVFIDEAGQALEASCWIPIIRSNRVILAGDHLQLPPTIKSYEASNQGMNITLFEKCIKKQNVHTLLQTQYRMNDEIMNFSSQKFYDSQLRSDISVKDQLLSDDINDELLVTPVNFIDTAGCGYTEEINKETLSLYNTEEAFLLYRHLNILIQQLRDQKVSIGIISPYKDQVTLLKKLLNHQIILPDNIKLVINTIDGFQGQEKDIIYISLVRSNDESNIGFLSDIRRMNVAMTRAKKKLIIIGDSSTIASDKFYKDFLDYIDSINSYSSAWEYME